LQEAIRQFQEKQLEVYKADPSRIIRDENSAEAVISDHLGRWLFELIQNCDDAEATKICIHITDTAVYIADNGKGFQPDAVESISGTHLSRKSPGSIGRKGIGFKAVYAITRNPQIFTLDDEGLEFNRSKAEGLLHTRGFNNIEPDDVPYQWLPFYVPRKESANSDGILAELNTFNTVIKLAFTSDELAGELIKKLHGFPSHGLLTFKHVCNLDVLRNKQMYFQLSVEREETVYEIYDTRIEPKQTAWVVAKQSLQTPSQVLDSVDKKQRGWLERVELLVATPRDNQGIARPTVDYYPVHVFYPTEEPCPVRIMLHAEFLVSSDRKGILSFEETPYNAWLAEKLAIAAAEFIKDRYDSREPAAYLRLLKPIPDLIHRPVAKVLWDKLIIHAREHFFLPNIEAKLVLPCAKAWMLGKLIAPPLARKILCVTPIGASVVHPSVDEDNDARQVLVELRCGLVDVDVICRAISEANGAKEVQTEWLLACWQWVSAWVEEGGQARDKEARQKQAKSLPIIPVNRARYTADSLSTDIVTWREDSSAIEIPDWAPLHFVENWFRDRLLATGEKDSVYKFACEIGIQKPGKNVLKRAVANAIRNYWDKKSGNPSRYIDFIMMAGWEIHTGSVDDKDVDEKLRRCPVLSRIEGRADSFWVPAYRAYFGQEWGEVLLPELYREVQGVFWVKQVGDEFEKARRVLEWLGVVAYPRVKKDTSESTLQSERMRIAAVLSPDYTSIKVEAGRILDGFPSLAFVGERAKILLILLARYWKDYYSDRIEHSIEYYYRSTKYRKVKALWWDQVLSQTIPPCLDNAAISAPIGKCWLPDHQTSKAIGELLSIIDLNSFDEHKSIVTEWLNDAVRPRTNLGQIRADEWRELLSERIPVVAPADSVQKKREKVFHWYESCVESLEGQEDVDDSDLEGVPLLCQKGERWEYVKHKPRWLADDDIATAFQDEIWLLKGIGKRKLAKKYFGLQSITENVKFTWLPDSEAVTDGPFHRILAASLPYIYVWRRETLSNPEGLKSLLTGLRLATVENLNVEVTLRGVASKQVQRLSGSDKSAKVIFLNMIAPEETRLSHMARAVADFLDVKTAADFLENLFRCKDDEQRTGKLLVEELDRETIARYIAEFSGAAEPEIHMTVNKPQGTTTPAPSPESSHSRGTVQISTGDKDVLPKPVVSTGDRTHSQVNLKNLAKARVSMKVAVEARSTSGTHSNRDTWNESTTDSEISPEGKTKIEQHGREVAARKLMELGYEVKQMPLDNPGFDIFASRGVQELRIEVKAHLRKANVVVLTIRELQESRNQKQDQQWELWNIENLSEDVGDDIKITRFKSIPEDALSAKQLRVDLNMCEPADVDKESNPS
jgi:hypothetical protein